MNNSIILRDRPVHNARILEKGFQGGMVGGAGGAAIGGLVGWSFLKFVEKTIGMKIPAAQAIPLILRFAAKTGVPTAVVGSVMGAAYGLTKESLPKAPKEPEKPIGLRVKTRNAKKKEKSQKTKPMTIGEIAGTTLSWAFTIAFLAGVAKMVAIDSKRFSSLSKGVQGYKGRPTEELRRIVQTRAANIAKAQTGIAKIMDTIQKRKSPMTAGEYASLQGLKDTLTHLLNPRNFATNASYAGAGLRGAVSGGVVGGIGGGLLGAANFLYQMGITPKEMMRTDKGVLLSLVRDNAKHAAIPAAAVGALMNSVSHMYDEYQARKLMSQYTKRSKTRNAKGEGKWITTDTGKHIQIKGGKITKGNIGQKNAPGGSKGKKTSKKPSSTPQKDVGGLVGKGGKKVQVKRQASAGSGWGNMGKGALGAALGVGGSAGGSFAGTAVGSAVGAGLGAAVGSIIPGAGTAAGAAAGRWIGGMAGGHIGGSYGGDAGAKAAKKYGGKAGAQGAEYGQQAESLYSIGSGLYDAKKSIGGFLSGKSKKKSIPHAETTHNSLGLRQFPTTNKWITTEGGKHIEIKGGEITKGNIGQKGGAGKSKGASSRQREIKEYRSLARRFEKDDVGLGSSDRQRYGQLEGKYGAKYESKPSALKTLGWGLAGGGLGAAAGGYLGKIVGDTIDPNLGKLMGTFGSLYMGTQGAAGGVRRAQEGARRRTHEDMAYTKGYKQQRIRNTRMLITDSKGLY